MVADPVVSISWHRWPGRKRSLAKSGTTSYVLSRDWVDPHQDEPPDISSFSPIQSRSRGCVMGLRPLGGPASCSVGSIDLPFPAPLRPSDFARLGGRGPRRHSIPVSVTSRLFDGRTRSLARGGGTSIFSLDLTCSRYLTNLLEIDAVRLKDRGVKMSQHSQQR